MKPFKPKHPPVRWFRVLRSKVLLFVATFLWVTLLVPAIAIESPQPPTHIYTTQSTATDAATLLQRGQQLYEAGQLQEAVRLWENGVAIAQQTNDIARLVASLNYLSMAYQQLGQRSEATQAVRQSLDILADLDATNQLGRLVAGMQLYAQALNSQAELQLSGGQAQEAIATWNEAETWYRQNQDVLGAIGSQMNQAQALQLLGYYRQAQELLETVTVELQKQPPSELKAFTLINLGTVLQVTGNLDEASRLLEDGIALLDGSQYGDETAAALVTLGNIHRIRSELDLAGARYQAAATVASSSTQVLQATLGQFNLALEQGQDAIARDLLARLQSQLATLPPSRMGVYARVNFAAALIKGLPEPSGRFAPNRRPLTSTPEIATILVEAVQQARQLGDRQAESYALGELGHLYEQASQYTEARQLTEQALALAQTVNRPEIAYRWQWQMGRIEVQQAVGHGGSRQPVPEKAIASYTAAVNTLKGVNRELLATNPEFQLSFRENVESVYRELADLLLQPGATPEDLQQVRTVLEDLQLAELENFFRSACLDVQTQQIDDIDPTAAVVYPLILSDRLEVILSVPDQPLQQFTTVLPQTEVDDTLEQLLQSLNPIFSDQLRLSLSQQVYDWLIRPLAPTLETSNIETLVFVLDGFLRNIPMSILHDGEQYLVEHYAVAMAPGLQLVDASARDTSVQVLTGGISEARQGFSALPGVKAEINEIAEAFPSETFLNQDFTKQNLQQQLASETFPIVHLATHGQFSSDPEQTFLLSWDNQIKVGEFENLVRLRQRQTARPIELLVLSACQTAAGDKQATLGLAGFAVKAGAQSTLATLWSVNDASTALFMTEFYQQLREQPTIAKSALLRQTQLSMIQQSEYTHPYYWAPFVLVGNWL
ncbi:MAG: CHAT domain-containing protein [Leptolyngbyaceae cyanobacterium]